MSLPEAQQLAPVQRGACRRRAREKPTEELHSMNSSKGDRTAVAVLITALVLGAVGVASASAATPEFTLKAGESFPASIGSTLHAGKVTFGWNTQLWGECSENKTEGSITGAKTASLTLEWAGCRDGTTSEHSEGAAEGHIVVTGTGQLTYISRDAEQVGIVLSLKEAKVWIGGSEDIILNGSLLIPITPLNSETSKLALPIHSVGLGVQEVITYEAEGRYQLSAFPLILFGTSSKSAGLEVSGTNELTTGKSVTVSASPPPVRPELVLGEGGKYPVSLDGPSPTTKAKLETVAGVISCEGVNTKGSITSGTAASLVLELGHCAEGERECSTPDSEGGDLVLEGSAGLYYIKKAEKRAGLVIALEAAEIHCETSLVKVQGKIVMPLTPVSTKGTVFALSLTRNGEAVEDAYSSYENESGEVVATKFEANFGTGYKKALLEEGSIPLLTNKIATVGV
jgi:hypothetical protein